MLNIVNQIKTNTRSALDRRIPNFSTISLIYITGLIECHKTISMLFKKNS